MVQKIWRNGKKQIASSEATPPPYTSPIIDDNDVSHSLLSFFYPFSSFLLGVPPQCKAYNQSLLPKIRNDRVRLSAKLTIWVWTFRHCKDFRPCTIRLYVSYNIKLREYLYMKFYYRFSLSVCTFDY